MEDTLQSIFSNIKDWLKFAEGKNGALFAADVATTFAFVNLLDDHPNLDAFLDAYIGMCVLFLMLSVAFCLISFAPQIRIPQIANWRNKGDKDGLLFFGDIARYDAVTYLRLLAQAKGLQADNNDLLLTQYAEQIVIISRITVWKYNWFNLALWATSCAFLSPLIGIPLGIAVIRLRRNG